MRSDFPLRSIEEERQKRLQSRKNEGYAEHAEFVAALQVYAGGSASEPILEAYRYAQSIEYHHPGLSAKAYLVHPVRIALLSMRFVDPIDSEIVITALLHNLLEVSSVSPEELARRFGGPVSQTIGHLTVDREQQNERDYKAPYYARLREGSRAGRVVKVLDKLDNLFLLCLNPDDQVRADYLAEIEDYIVPMAQDELPVLVEYLKDLVRNCRATGYCQMAEGATSWN